MAQKHYVFSTLTAAQVYTRTETGSNDMPKTIASVRIEGGSNVPDKNLVTPIGVMTEVDDGQLTVLQENPVFQRHVKNGFVRVEKKAVPAEKVAADMPTRDESAPLVDQDFTEEDKKPKNNRKA